MKQKRGFTLVEVLIASALFLLVLTLTFGYLLPAVKAAGRVRTMAQLQQTISVVFRQIETAAATTSPAGFSWSNGPELIALSFNPLDELQGVNALLRWTEHYDVFWWDQTERLLRHRTWPPGSPSPASGETGIIRAKRLSPERMLGITSAGEPSLALARGVTNFRVTHSGSEDGVLIQPVRIEMTLVEEGRSANPEGAVSLTQTIVFRMENQQ